MRSVSLGMAANTAAVVGTAVPLAGRTKGTATLLVAALTGSPTITLEAAGTNDQVVWDVLKTVSPTGPGITEVKLGEDVKLQPWHAWVRWNLTVPGTSVTLGATVAMPFVDAIDDALLFSQELREWKDGFARTIDAAETDVLNELFAPQSAVPIGLPIRIRPTLPVIDRARYAFTDVRIAELITGAVTTPVLTIDLAQQGAGDDMRRAIVVQAEHRFRRHKLQLQSDPASVVSLRNYSELAPGLLRALDKRRNRTVTSWRGR